MFKTFRLFKDLKGHSKSDNSRSFWFVFRSKELREAVVGKLIKKFPELNYRIDWNDVNGYGLQLSECKWVQKGGFYYLP